MTITTLDGALAGMQPPQPLIYQPIPSQMVGVPQSLWWTPGTGSGGSQVATTAGGVALSSSSGLVAGQIYHADPAGGLNSYLARFNAVASNQGGQLLLCDRLLMCEGTTAGTAISMTVTTTQVINTVALPARDSNGTTNGVGVLAALECINGMGAGTPTVTFSYTNSAGVSGRTGTNVYPILTNSAQGSFYPIGLQAGDQGVQSVQSMTLSATMTSGTLGITLYRIIASLELPGIGIGASLDALTAGFPQLFNGVVPWLLFIPTLAGSSGAMTIFGTYVETQG